MLRCSTNMSDVLWISFPVLLSVRLVYYVVKLPLVTQFLCLYLNMLDGILNILPDVVTII